jgi:ankyrin repeat protein
VWRYLIETKCCDVNAQDNSKDTPLHDAILFFDPNKGGDITVLNYLLSQKDVNGNIVGEYGYTLLHWACNNINRLPLEIFKLLIETLGGDVNAQANNKDTPIHRALVRFPRNGDISVLQYLFNQTNVDANTKGQYDSTILHIACEEVNALPIDIFKVLIETAGCDVNAQNKYNDTPLHKALDCFDPSWGGKITALIYLLSQKGVDVNINGKNGYTLLHTACKNINKLPLDVFKVLIETIGCDVNEQDNDKNTPLHDALRYFDPRNGGDIAVLTYLLTQKGINGNIKGQDDKTLLHETCQKINHLPLDIFKVLIETAGCDVNAQDKYNDTPLHVAFRYFDPNKGGDITALAYLINQKTVNVNNKYTKGCNLLHSACIINLSTTWDPAKKNAECDTILCQIVELIAERCVQEVLEETIPLEAATTTM